MTWARLVLPTPGRAEEEDVVEGLAAAAWRPRWRRCRLATTWGWPTYSSRRARAAATGRSRRRRRRARPETRRGSVTRALTGRETICSARRRRSSKRPSPSSRRARSTPRSASGARVAEVAEGGEQVLLRRGRAARRGRARGARRSGGHLVLQLEHQALGRLLAHAGDAGEARRRRSPRRAATSSAASMPERMLTASLGPTPATAMSRSKRSCSCRGEEAEEGEGVLAHVGVDAQAAPRRPRRRGGRRWRRGWRRGSRRRPRPRPPPAGPCAGRGRAGARSRAARGAAARCWRCAWQSATARASAASPASPSPGEGEEARHHEGHLRLLRAAEAGDLDLHRGRREGGDGQAGLRAASRTTPRTWPSTRARAGVDGVEDVLDRQDVRAAGAR